MRARTHPGAEKHVETSSSNQTMDREKLEQNDLEQNDSDSRKEAKHDLNQSGLTAEDVASQSAYSGNEADVTQQAANANKNKAG